MSGAGEESKAADGGWMNTGTYIGVGGLVIALLLWFTRSVKPMLAGAIAVVALGAGWYMQPAKAKAAAAEPESG